MKTSERGIQLITDLCTVSNKIYLDSYGFLSIGIGHSLTKDEITSGEIFILAVPAHYTDDGLTDLQMSQLFTQDLAIAEGAVNVGIKIELTQTQFDAIVSLAFSIGRQSFLNSQLRRVLNDGQYEQAESQMLQWVRSGGRVIPSLKRRRESEVDLFRGTLKCQQ